MVANAHSCETFIHANTLQWRRLTTPDWYWFRWNIRHIACYVDFGRAGRTLICFGAHSNLDVLLLGYYDDDRECTPVWNIYTCNHIMATALDSGLILISVEYTAHCHVDFGRAARTFICFGAHSNSGVSLIGYYNDRNCTSVCYIYIYMQPHSNGDVSFLTPDWYWFRWNIRHIVMLTLDEQHHVR